MLSVGVNRLNNLEDVGLPRNIDICALFRPFLQPCWIDGICYEERLSQATYELNERLAPFL